MGFGNPYDEIWNEYFEELGLPIWVVESYSEIEKLSEAVLSDKYNELSRRFDSKWLWARTWLEEINSKISESYEFYKNAKHIIITYGTAYFYKNVNTMQVVNNCHQFPNHIFEKQIGNTKMFSDSFFDVYNTLIVQNPEINITLTLSPIKHYRDGIIENNLSKSVLTCFIHAVLAAAKNTEYFPSYEIVNDELRDYRFYKENLTHPNDLAIEIIWEKFLETKIAENSKEFIRNYQTLVKLKTHRIRQLGTIAHQQFIDKGLEELKSLSQKYPTINFASEYEYFHHL
jgi:hypothetical protein